MTSLRINIKLFYLHRLIAGFLLIAPILIPYYQYHHLGMQAFYTAQAIYALTIFVMEIPSGYLADIIGRRKTMLIGAIIFPAGILIYTLSSSLLGFFLAEFLVAVGNSMHSGCDSALLYDTLIALQEENSYQRIEGRGNFFSRSSTGLASIAGGLLAVLSLRLPFWVNLGVALLAIPVTFMMREPPRKMVLSAGSHWKKILQIFKETVKNRALRPFIFYSALLGTISIIALWAYFIYYQQISVPLGLFGLLFALFQFSGAMGARLPGRLRTQKDGFKMVASSLGIGLILLLVAALKSPLMILLIMAHPFLWNVAMPPLLEQINRRTASPIRATVLSIANMGRSLAYILTAPLVGMAIDRFALSTSFLLLAVIFISLALVLLKEIRINWAATEGKPVLYSTYAK